MAIQFSTIAGSNARSIGQIFSVQSLDIATLAGHAAPVFVVDDFRVSAQPFGPHPHAGFSAVTYVFEDSRGSLRSRDSLGNDLVVGAGGIVWTQAGRGAQHEELPARAGEELHGLQVFVKLSAENELVAPQVLHLQGEAVPEWRNMAGERVRVAVGSFGGVTSPLRPAEPFQLLDVELRREIALDLPAHHNALIYVARGDVAVHAGDHAVSVAAEQGLALYGDGGTVALKTTRDARLFVLSAADLREPMLSNGPFVMSDSQRLAAATARFRAGEMGALEALAKAG